MSEVFYIRGKRFEVNDNIGVTVDACGTEICVTFKDSNNGRAAEEAYKKLMKEGRYEQQQPNAVQADNAAFGGVRMAKGENRFGEETHYAVYYLKQEA